MNLTPNWSHRLYEHAASVTGEDAPSGKIKPCTDAMPFPAATTIDWSSVPLRLYTDFCYGSAPPPNPKLTPACFFEHDHASLTGTA
jgi:hypothetical protein